MGVCCYTFLKYIVMIFNFLYMLLGGALLGLSLWVYLGVAMAPVTKDIEGYNYVLFFLMGVGAVMFIMGFLGCCGACQESQCMLATFFALVFVLFVGQIAAGIWLNSNFDRFRKMVESSISDSIKNDYQKDKVKTQAFDVIQIKMKCCGATGYRDWSDSHFNGAKEIGIPGALPGSGKFAVPQSCCKDVKGPDCEDATKDLDLIAGQSSEPEHIYTEGCADKLLDFVEKYNYEILGVVGAILLVEVLAMIFSMVLCCTVRRIDNVKA